MKKLVIIAILFALKAGAQSGKAYTSRGNEYYLQLKFDLAEDQYRQALNLEPRNNEAKYNLANALMQQKKFREAIEFYTEVTGSDNRNLRAAAHYNIGVSYTKQKDLPASIEAYKAALRINPEDKEARENLQKAIQEQKKQEEEQKKGGGGGGGMSQKEAENKLKQLQDKERELQQRMQNAGKGKGNGGRKDW
ncbi:tetratricopeptide repeat protein [Flavisolibacter sp. BT320]|nr:tetratricopeptide repeat protein [Flavisolibacter longurius]